MTASAASAILLHGKATTGRETPARVDTARSKTHADHHSQLSDARLLRTRGRPVLHVMEEYIVLQPHTRRDRAARAAATTHRHTKPHKRSVRVGEDEVMLQLRIPKMADTHT